MEKLKEEKSDFEITQGIKEILFEIIEIFERKKFSTAETYFYLRVLVDFIEKEHPNLPECYSIAEKDVYFKNERKKNINEKKV
jgi:hypothetical protein